MTTITSQRVRRWLGAAAIFLALSAGLAAAATVGRSLVGAIESLNPTSSAAHIEFSH